MPTATTRAVLILDENLHALRPHLEQKNFRAYPVSSGMKDDQIALALTHRIFVTNNAKDFREPAAIHEFSIIDTSAATKDPEHLAQQISKVWVEKSLRSKQPFYARLLQDGGVVVTEIDA